MEFVHQPYQPGETIAAIATPPGEGGVAIVRISGHEALKIADRVFSGPIPTYKSHTVHYGYVKNLNGERVDDVLAIVMKAPNSYTGEDTVELHCHGGSLISRRVLETVLTTGIRAALPGEFTFKAFINGKIDLAQAEAVQELICAKNERAVDAAELQLEGSLSKKIKSFQDKLTKIAAILEAWVDFPEEGLEFATLEEIAQDLQAVVEFMEKLVASFHEGKILHEGITLCLAGSPNVGKSSLMNALLDKERAIVSAIPGTTRDVLEDHLRLNGLNIKLMDTAGIRKTEEQIEKEGIRRSREAMQKADLILLVLDATQEIGEEERELIALAPSQKTIGIWNKIDLPHQRLPSIDLKYITQVSAKEKTGFDHLHKVIDALIWENGPPSKEEVVITNIRHKEALANAIEACRKVVQGLYSGTSPEFLTVDMRSCLAEMGKILGTNVSEDIITSIFSQFCLGK